MGKSSIKSSTYPTVDIDSFVIVEDMVNHTLTWMRDYADGFNNTLGYVNDLNDLLDSYTFCNDVEFKDAHDEELITRSYSIALWLLQRIAPDDTECPVTLKEFRCSKNSIYVLYEAK